MNKNEVKNKDKLEGCIDDERQFNTAKRSQTPACDATALTRFPAITSLLFVVYRKDSIFRISDFFYMCLYANVQFS